MRLLLALLLLLVAAPTAVAQAPPCAPGTPSALRFAGLPERIESGRQHVFSLAADDPAWFVVGRVTASARSGDHLLFEAPADPDAQLGLLLRPRQPATVTAVFEQATGASPACVRTITAATRGFRHFRLIDRCDEPSFKPRRVILACGDGGYGLRTLRWRGWNRSQATARGLAYANDCLPSCAQGRLREFRVRVRAFRPRRLTAGTTYTRLRVTFPGRRPRGIPRVEVRRAFERDGNVYGWR